MTSQPNQTCVCGHGLDEHQRESLICQMGACPCQQFIQKVLDRTFEELQASTLQLIIKALRDAHARATRLRLDVQNIPFARPFPPELEPFKPLLEVAEINLTATMHLLETIVDACTEEPHA